MSTIVLGILPLFLFWKHYSVFDNTLAVQVHWEPLEFAACFVQDIFVWCAAYLTAVFISRFQSSLATFTVVFLSNLVLIVQMVDGRVKIQFLEPLSFDLMSFAMQESTLLTQSIGLFFGVNYWKAGLISLIFVNAIAGIVVRPFWYFKKPMLLQISKGTERIANKVACVLLVVTLALSFLVPAQAYGLHANFLYTITLGRLTENEVEGHRGHKELPSPQPVRLSSEADFAHVLDPKVAIAKGHNVILYVMESTSDWAVDLGGADTRGNLFHELVANGALARPCYSTFATSTKSMYVLQSGTFASPTEEVLETQIRNQSGLPRTLRAAGYHTEFISAQNLSYQGSRNQFVHMGYHRVSGLTELARLAKSKNVKVSDNGFGDADDRLMFLEGFKRLSNKQPFLLTFFTSASHYPYDYPGNPEGSDEDRYFRAIRFTQDVIREMMEKLDEIGMLENTLIVITSDHGEEFVEGQFRGRGTTLTEKTHRVPLVIYSKGNDLGGYSKQHTRHVDVFPTILDLLGVAPLNIPLQGVSIFKDPRKQPVYLNTLGRIRSIALIEQDEKIIHSLDTGQTMVGSMLANDVDSQLKRLKGNEKNDEIRRMKEFSIYNEALLRDLFEGQ